MKNFFGSDWLNSNTIDFITIFFNSVLAKRNYNSFIVPSFYQDTFKKPNEDFKQIFIAAKNK